VWYWYQSWIDRCIELCGLAGERFKGSLPPKPSNLTMPPQGHRM